MRIWRAALASASIWRLARVHGQATPATTTTTTTSSLTNDWQTAFPNPNGGWALRSGGEGQGPLNATECQNKEWVCPNSLHCVNLVESEGYEYGPYACCPDASQNCTQQLLEKPTCADPIWGLYPLTDVPLNGSRYCCYPFQRGTQRGFCDLPNGLYPTYVESISQVSYTGVRPTPTSSSAFVSPTTTSQSSGGSSSRLNISTIVVVPLVIGFCVAVVVLVILVVALPCKRGTSRSKLRPPPPQIPMATTTTIPALPGGYEGRSATPPSPPPFPEHDYKTAAMPEVPATTATTIATAAR